MPNPLHLINYACATCQANLCLQRLNDVDPSFEPIFCLCTNLADLACALRRHRPWALLALASGGQKVLSKFSCARGVKHAQLPASSFCPPLHLLLRPSAGQRGLMPGPWKWGSTTNCVFWNCGTAGASSRCFIASVDCRRTVAVVSQWLPRL